MDNTAVTTPTSEPHYVVARLLDLPKTATPAQLVGGFRTTPSAVKFMFQHRELWRYVVIPALINVVLFVVTIGTLLWNYDWFLLPEPESLILYALWWIYRILLFPLLIFIGYFITMLLGGIIASPFNDTLSERAEQVMMGHAPTADEGWQAMLVGAVEGILMAAATGIPRMILVLLVSLVPGLGPVLAAIVGAYFVAVGFTDSAFARRKYSVRRRLATVWKYRGVAVGFGLSANMLMLIPLLNFLCLPIAVVGGTAVAIALDELESAPHDK